jgi:ABC-type antimicrobial peptide transport system permease subunit
MQTSARENRRPTTKTFFLRAGVLVLGGFLLATLVAWLVLVGGALLRTHAPESAWNPSTPATLLLQAAQAGVQAGLPSLVLLLITLGFIAARNGTKGWNIGVAISATSTLISFLLTILIFRSEPYLIFVFAALTYWALCGVLVLWIAKRVFAKLR